MRGLAARGSEAPSCDELEMTVRAIWDGEQPINHQFHTFVPSDWLARAAPDQAEFLRPRRAVCPQLLRRPPAAASRCWTKA